MTKSVYGLSRVVALLVLALCCITPLKAQHNWCGIPFDLASCFFAVGGGLTPFGGTLQQPQTESPECIVLYEMYFQLEKGQYWTDLEVAVEAGRPLLENRGNYSTMVVFDVDDTTLSNVPLYQATNFTPSVEEYDAYIASEEAPSVFPTLEFYRDLIAKGYALVFVTERPESARDATVANLYREGYGKKCADVPASPGAICYVDLIMKADADDRDATVFKSEARGKLKADGFVLVASVGDQWSDLLGTDSPPTLVKLPNPLYYVP